MKTSAWLGILAFLGLIGGISLLPERPETPKQVKKEIQVKETSYPISILKLEKSINDLNLKLFNKIDFYLYFK